MPPYSYLPYDIGYCTTISSWIQILSGSTGHNPATPVCCCASRLGHCRESSFSGTEVHVTGCHHLVLILPNLQTELRHYCIVTFVLYCIIALSSISQHTFICRSQSAWYSEYIMQSYHKHLCNAWLQPETSRWVLINAFFQVKLKLRLSKLLSTSKVIVNFANDFHSAEYALITNLIWAKPINDQSPQCV